MVATTKRASKQSSKQPAAVEWAPSRRRFSVDEYDGMIAAGILREGERVELIEGEIVRMAAIGSKHAGCVTWLIEWFGSKLGGLATVRSQSPVHLGADSEPEPDLALLSYRPDQYRHAHPTPSDVLLLIEVADTSLPFDRGVKQELYARAGIREFWIVDLAHEQLLVHRAPQERQYTEVTTVARGGTISPLSFPELTVEVNDILG